jgi:amidophosphoribosyltransferase
MCGVIGIFDNEEVIRKMYNGMLTLQHRGQDSAGILTFDKTFHTKKGNGLIRDIFDENNLDRLRGHVGIGHTRYPTVGEGSAEDAQPFWINYPFGIAGAHNGNVSNFIELKEELFTKYKILINSNCDVEVIINFFAQHLNKIVKKELKPKDIFEAVNHVYKKVKGSYSVVLYIAGKGMVAFRDPFGLRPLLFAKKGNVVPSYSFASESVALKVMDFEKIRDLQPGSAIFIDSKREVFEKKIINKPFRPCIFEYIYFARPDSDMNGINVSAARIQLGRKLAARIQESGIDFDLIVPVPDSARTAAIEIAKILKVKYREGLVKNRYIGRTFIMPGNKIRKKSIRHKMNPVESLLKDRKVLLVDDSIVRGNTSRAIIQMVRDAGANKVFFASYSSPVAHPCVYGIDMQTKNEFIATNSSPAKIAKKIGADAVIYQDIKDMEAGVRVGNKTIKKFCKACFDGQYPTKDVSDDMLDKIEQERKNSKN